MACQALRSGFISVLKYSISANIWNVRTFVFPALYGNGNALQMKVYSVSMSAIS